jgi:hypothetical protein
MSRCKAPEFEESAERSEAHSKNLRSEAEPILSREACFLVR